VDVERGVVFKPSGQPVRVHTSGRYPRVCLPIPKQYGRASLPIPVHKVVAYAIWGEAAIASGAVVRHKDDNRPDDNGGDNLLLGTALDNWHDRPVLERARSARRAARTRQRLYGESKQRSGGHPERWKVPSSEHPSIKERYALGAMLKDLAAEYKVSIGTISRIVQNRYDYDEVKEASIEPAA
jgi:hypothetical protein